VTAHKHEYTLDLPKLVAGRHAHRNLCVELQRSPDGHHRAVLIDLGEFCGTGSTQGIAIDDLADELERAAAEIRRESGKVVPDLERVRAVYAAAVTWRRHMNRVSATLTAQALVDTIDAAIATEETVNGAHVQDALALFTAPRR
jgi:hypothetical protein